MSAHEQRKARVSPGLDTPLYVTHDQAMRMAQYGISHDHAHDKARVLQENESVEFAGVYEPSAETIKQLGSHEAYKAVHWFSSKEEILEDQKLYATLGILEKGIETSIRLGSANHSSLSQEPATF